MKRLSIATIQTGLLVLGVVDMFAQLALVLLDFDNRADHFVVFIEVVAGTVLIYLPQLIARILHLTIPTAMILPYFLFLFLAVFLGTAWNFYHLVPFWDNILHLISPAILTVLGYGILRALLGNQSIADVGPWVYLVFGFCFAEVCGVFWEFWETSWDAVFDLNLQRYLLESGQPIVGRAALDDTMTDLLMNTIGALLTGLFIWWRQRQTDDYFARYQLEYKK